MAHKKKYENKKKQIDSIPPLNKSIFIIQVKPPNFFLYFFLHHSFLMPKKSLTIDT